jgi:hypothetical protein
MRLCIKCGVEIHPKRLEILPNVTVCVNCSTAGRKRGVNVQLGEGDHTYDEIIIMEEDQYKKYIELEQSHRKTVAGQVALYEFETGLSESDGIEPEFDVEELNNNDQTQTS